MRHRPGLGLALTQLLMLPVLVVACATPASDPGPSGSGGSGSGNPGSGGSGSGNPGTGGSSTTGGGTGTGGASGTGTGGASGTGTGGTSGGRVCTPMPTQLINASAWNCNLTDTTAIQGAIYPYGDGASCPFGPTSPPTNICTTGSCCLMGTTVVDTTFMKWGCGIGMELSSSGGTAPTKKPYTGPVKCFNITLTGSSGGNVVRIGFTQSASPPAGAVAPYKEIPSFTNGWTGQVCFADVSCPSWAVTSGACTKTGTDGTPVDMQLQISAGSTPATVGAYNVCISSIVPVVSGGGGGGSTNSCTSTSGSGTINTQFGDAHVTCSGKDYIVQNNAWGSTAGQTITFGPGTKFKVAQQNGTGANGNPASYPSVFTGAYNNRSSAGSGLPRAISQIPAGSVSTSWTWSDTGVTGSYNAAYDVWFSTGAGGDPAAAAPSGGYLMVWYYDPPDNQPIGATIPNGTVTIGGKQFEIWYGLNGGKPVVSYVAAQKMTSWTFKLGDFIQDAIARNCQGTTKCLQPSWYLSAVFAGFEIWRGGTNLETTDFAVTVP